MIALSTTVITAVSNLAVISAAVIAVASLIAALTPTPKDDEWIGKLYKIIDLLALNIGKAKDKGGHDYGP